MFPRQYVFMKLLRKYGLEGRADINGRVNFPDSGYFLVPIKKDENETMEFPFEFLFELDCLLRKKTTRFSKWLWKRKLSKPKKIKGKKFLRCFCFKIESPITVTELHDRVKAEELHFTMANLCYE